MSGAGIWLLAVVGGLGLTLALIGLLAAARAAARTFKAAAALRVGDVIPTARLRAAVARLQTNAAMIPFEAQRAARAFTDLQVALRRLGIPQGTLVARRLLLHLLG